jgi:NTP pyrophosphatase (non-canonical NTP hydrolase)
MGLVGELAEVKAAETLEHFMEEAGDFLWYAAELCSVEEFDLTEVNHLAEEIRASDMTAELVERAKKYLFFNKKPDEIAVKSMLVQSMAAVLPMLRNHDLDFADLADSNLRKLETRHNKKTEPHDE